MKIECWAIYVANVKVGGRTIASSSLLRSCLGNLGSELDVIDLSGIGRFMVRGARNDLELAIPRMSEGFKWPIHATHSMTKWFPVRNWKPHDSYNNTFDRIRRCSACSAEHADDGWSHGFSERLALPCPSYKSKGKSCRRKT